jgi:hypothetical protein
MNTVPTGSSSGSGSGSATLLEPTSLVSCLIAKVRYLFVAVRRLAISHATCSKVFQCSIGSESATYPPNRLAICPAICSNVCYQLSIPRPLPILLPVPRSATCPTCSRAYHFRGQLPPPPCSNIFYLSSYSTCSEVRCLSYLSRGQSPDLVPSKSATLSKVSNLSYLFKDQLSDLLHVSRSVTCHPN